MGMIRTLGNFCYVECDARDCTKKMEHVDETLLRQLAGLCGWESKGDQWICPNCLEISSRKTRGTPRSRRRAQVTSKA